jgi:hypothetical protein
MSGSLLTRLLVPLAAICFLATAQAQPSEQARYADHLDPPERVGYVSDSRGAVSHSPAGTDDWLNLIRNRPLVRGDRLWTDRGARIELQIGSTSARLGPETGFELLELDDLITQIQITEGMLNLSVRRLRRGESLEVATPHLAFSIYEAGRYRIDVDPYRDETTLVVWEGAGEAWGEGASFPLAAGDTVRFYGADLRDHQIYALARPDAFDRYCEQRDQRLARSQSLRYVSDDMVGYASLDDHGRWRSIRNHGNVWFPNEVASDWAPYRDGHWVWQEPWGWTWVDNAPWGFAPAHYGRWVSISNRWGWLPGPRNARAVYAPALVAFVGGSNWSLTLTQGNRVPIGWFALGPREVYVPSYRASRDYFRRVNVTSTVVNTTVINNVYNNYSSGTINVNQVNYANRSVQGAVTVVPASVFRDSRQVRGEALRLDGNAMNNVEVRRVAEIAPNRRSLQGSAAAAERKPSAEAFARGVVARTPPPAAVPAFAAGVEQLRRNPGRPLQLRNPEPGSNGRADTRKAPENVRVIQTPAAAVNVREIGSRRSTGVPGVAASEPPPLDREKEAAAQPQATDPRPATGQRQRDTAAQQLRQNQRDEAAQQQAADRQRQLDARQKQAAAEQQAAEQREAATQRQRDATRRQRDATQQQAAERQRQLDARQKQAAGEQQAAEQREAAAQRQRDAAQQQAVERQRQLDAREKQAAGEQQAAEQREAAAQRQRDAGQQQAAERQSQIEARAQQEAAAQSQARPKPAPAVTGKKAATDSELEDEEKDTDKDKARGRGRDDQ